MARKPIYDKPSKKTKKVVQENDGPDRSEDLFRETGTAWQFLNVLEEIAAVADTKGVILAANEAMPRRFGRQVHELLGASPWDGLRRDVAERRKRHLREVIKRGQPVRFEDENMGTCFDNVLYPILDGKGKGDRVTLRVPLMGEVQETAGE